MVAGTLMFLDDTIAAIATPIGERGLAVIRISGAEAFNVAYKVFVPGGHSSKRVSEAPTHTPQYGHIIHKERPIAEVLAAVMHAPRTFTREHVEKFTCHRAVLTSKMV